MTVLSAIQQRIEKKLPQVPAKITRYTPPLMLEGFLNIAINHLLQQERTKGELHFLEGQVARVEITDLNFNFSMTLEGQRLHIKVPGVAGDATLKSDQDSMLQILHGEVDPDTLFFRRKLLITGDTELGLYIKNMIDTIDLRQRIPKPFMKFLTKINEISQ